MVKSITVLLLALMVILALTNGWSVIAIACCLGLLGVADIVSAAVTL